LNGPNYYILKAIFYRIRYKLDIGAYMIIRILLEPSDEGGYTAIIPSLPGCVSEGETREEAIANIREAIELYLEPVEDDHVPVPNAEILELAI
jgi:predicted RNase H-like HicB family nuclease